jgi:aryl-alcohol dehydrogenase-like predicted oxidoreductase
VAKQVQLGSGLIRIGRPWGHVNQDIPSESQAFAFLEHAVALGIRYFDTAPSYGLSEERFGRFLRSLPADLRNLLTIATKFGEHWDAGGGQPYVDHSLDALRRSLDRSIEMLGRIDVLQLHKTTPSVLTSDDLSRAWEYAHALGISRIGASVSDIESAAIATSDPRYSVIQLPLNVSNRTFEASMKGAADREMFVAANRPFAMGAMLHGDQPVSVRDAFAWLLSHDFEGVILSGTASIAHLTENWDGFQNALAGVRAKRTG